MNTTINQAVVINVCHSVFSSTVNVILHVTLHLSTYVFLSIWREIYNSLQMERVINGRFHSMTHYCTTCISAIFCDFRPFVSKYFIFKHN